jgi:hypothetical protein
MASTPTPGHKHWHASGPTKASISALVWQQQEHQQEHRAAYHHSAQEAGEVDQARVAILLRVVAAEGELQAHRQEAS